MPVEYDLIAPDSQEPEVVANANFAKTKEAIDALEAGGGGSGLPAGGTTGQFLAKTSDDDGDADWVNAPSGGGGGGGTPGAVNIVTVRRNTGYIWPDGSNWNLVPYEAIIDEDVPGVWSAADPGKFFMPEGGYTRMRFTAFFVFDTNGGAHYVHLLDKLNQNVGLNLPGKPTQSLWYQGVGRGGNQLVSRWLTVPPGDWYTFKCFPTSNLYAGPDNGYPFVQVELV